LRFLVIAAIQQRDITNARDQIRRTSFTQYVDGGIARGAVARAYFYLDQFMVPYAGVKFL
jgi:hypothetical protein